MCTLSYFLANAHNPSQRASDKYNVCVLSELYHHTREREHVAMCSKQTIGEKGKTENPKRDFVQKCAMRIRKI
jgi:hypothetical protein